MIQEYISFKAPVPTHQTSCNRISAGVLGFNFSPGFQGFWRVLVFLGDFLGFGGFWRVFLNFGGLVGGHWEEMSGKSVGSGSSSNVGPAAGSLSTDPLILLRVALPLCFCSFGNSLMHGVVYTSWWDIAGMNSILYSLQFSSSSSAFLNCHFASARSEWNIISQWNMHSCVPVSTKLAILCL